MNNDPIHRMADKHYDPRPQDHPEYDEEEANPASGYDYWADTIKDQD